MTLTSLSSVYLSNEINKFFPMNGKVTVNATISLLENSYTKSLSVKRDVQNKLIEVIQVKTDLQKSLSFMIQPNYPNSNKSFIGYLITITSRLVIVILGEATSMSMDR